MGSDIVQKCCTSPKKYWFSLSTGSSTPFDHLAKRHLRMFHLLNVTRTDDIKGESQLFDQKLDRFRECGEND